MKAAVGSRALYAVVAAALLALAPIEQPVPHLSFTVAAVVGAGAGAVLFGALARRLPPPPTPSVARAVALAAPVVLLGAACEEAIWRFGLFGGLRPVLGTAAAFSLSTVAFAVAHAGRAPPRALSTHAGTGATFAAVYAGSGRLAAAVAAHTTYNLLVVAACAAWSDAIVGAKPGEAK